MPPNLENTQRTRNNTTVTDRRADKAVHPVQPVFTYTLFSFILLSLCYALKQLKPIRWETNVKRNTSKEFSYSLGFFSLPIYQRNGLNTQVSAVQVSLQMLKKSKVKIAI